MVISLRTNGSSNDPLGTKLDQGNPGPIAGLILLLVVLTGVLTFFCSTYRIFTLPEYRVGDIVNSDIVVPTDVPMQDEEATKIRQQEAQRNALPVYRHTANQVESQIKQICRLFSVHRNKVNTFGSKWFVRPNSGLHQFPPEMQVSLRNPVSYTHLTLPTKA